MDKKELLARIEKAEAMATLLSGELASLLQALTLNDDSRKKTRERKSVNKDMGVQELKARIIAGRLK